MEIKSPDWNALAEQAIQEAIQKINNSPETKQFQKEMEYLQTINDIFEGKIKLRSDKK